MLLRRSDGGHLVLSKRIVVPFGLLDRDCYGDRKRVPQSAADAIGEPEPVHHWLAGAERESEQNSVASDFSLDDVDSVSDGELFANADRIPDCISDAHFDLYT